MKKAMIYNDQKGLNEMLYNDSYAFIKKMVGGYIERVYIPSFEERGIDIWCNEEGKLMGLRPSIALTMKGKVYDFVVGNIIFTKCDDGEETVSLTDEDILFINNWYDNTDWVINTSSTSMIPTMEYSVE